MTRKIMITGGSGFVGRILRAGLKERGYQVSVFDRMRGPAVDLLRGRYWGTATSESGRAKAINARNLARRIELAAIKRHWLRPTADDILGPRTCLVDRFRGQDAVIHLAGLPHPNVPGATDDSFQRVNFDGSVNVYEAAREAGVRKFIFASSCQVYGINAPPRLDQFPILESNYCPTRAEGQTAYGWLKLQFECYLARQRHESIQAAALRLEFPGVLSRFDWNLYISTSIENTVAGFAAAIEADLSSGFEAFNLADGVVDPQIVNIRRWIAEKWPTVPDRILGNQCLLSTEKAQSMLGYRPKAGGTYYAFDVMW